jgi:cytoskeleton protein RodZ
VHLMNDSQRDTAQATDDTALSAGAQPASAGAASTHTAGEILRRAREDAGLHIESLAAALKVPVKKLESLENNRWEDLTDATFSRALASSVARHLKLDPAMVLAALPASKAVPLVISGGLGRATPAHGGSSGALSGALRWVVGVVLLAAVLLYFAPQWLPSQADGPLPATAVPTYSSADPADRPLQGGEPVLSPTQNSETPTVSEIAPSPGVVAGSSSGAALPAVSGQAAAEGAAPAAAGLSNPPAADTSGAGKELMAVQARGDTWLEVRDSTGRLRIQRLVKAGERLSFEDGSTYTVVVGNAAATDLTVRGKAVDLLALTKNNVARLEVQ